MTNHANFQNRSLFVCDNVHVLDNLNSESVDLIYLDPPFNSNRNYAAPIGSRAAGAAFKDTWTLDDVDKVWVQQIRQDNEKLATIIEAVGTLGGGGR